ncbi:MAG: hypothetical protein DRQ99_30610 [Candidatus Parabeggiatoa sp. nov. 3]|nr:MAG: hypothetical protein DRQ99_30610 [Gammaproteobacteria bacterium]
MCYKAVTDSLDAITQYHWLPETGQVYQQTDPLARITKTEYDAQGRIIAELAPNGAKTVYGYDEFGNRNKIVNPLGQGYIITPNALLDPAGQLWERRFDKKNRLTKVIAPTGAIWSFDYDESGNLIKITDPNGAYKEQEFSRQGILTKSTDWEGHPTYYRTDDLGRVVLRQNAAYNNVYFEYDRLGNPTKITLPDQNQIFAQYDCDNNLTALINAKGQGHYWEYSTCKRLLKTTNPLRQTVHYHWGSEHDILEAITNEKGEFCHFTYNPAEQLEEQTGFDGRSLKWVYDPRTGELIKTINGLWQETTYKRDALGRVIEKQIPDGSAEHFEYDPNGNLIAAINPDCTVTLERDALGRIIQETQDDFVIRHQYDQVGNLIHTETNLGTWIDSDYDGNGAITRLNFGGENQFDWKLNRKRLKPMIFRQRLKDDEFLMACTI